MEWSIFSLSLYKFGNTSKTFQNHEVALGNESFWTS